MLAKTKLSETDEKDLQNLFENLKPSICANLIAGYSYLNNNKNACERKLTKKELISFDKIFETGFLHKITKMVNQFNIDYLQKMNGFFSFVMGVDFKKLNINNEQDVEQNPEILSVLKTKTNNMETNTNHIGSNVKKIENDLIRWNAGELQPGEVGFINHLFESEISLLLSDEKYDRIIDLAVKNGLNKNVNVFEDQLEEERLWSGILNLYRQNNKDVSEFLKPHPITGRNIFNVAIENYNSFAVEYLLNIEEFAGKVNLKKLVKAYNKSYESCSTLEQKRNLLKIKELAYKYAEKNGITVKFIQENNEDKNDYLGNLPQEMIKVIAQELDDVYSESLKLTSKTNLKALGGKVPEQTQGFVGRLFNNVNPKKCGCTIL